MPQRRRLKPLRPWAELTPEQQAFLLEIEVEKAMLEDETGIRPDFVGIEPAGFEHLRPPPHLYPPNPVDSLDE